MDDISYGSSKGVDGRVRWAIKYLEIENIPPIFENNDFTIDWDYKHVFKNYLKKEDEVDKNLEPYLRQ